MSDAQTNNIEISDPTRLVESPVASVLMVTYNHGPFLAEAIEGVLRQKANFPIELLIGEDHSSDDTRAVGLRYQKLHPQLIRVIFSDTNIGQHRNYARLVRASRGEFIAYCDGDDYWSDPEKLQRQVDYLRSHPDTGAVHTDFDNIVWRGGRWRRLSNFLKRWSRDRPLPQGDIFPTLLCGNFVQICTLCVRADLAKAFMNSGLLKDAYSVNDWPLCLYIAQQGKVAFLPESMAVYRKARGSITNSGHAARARFVADYIPMIEDFCDRFRVDPFDRNAALTRHYRQLLSFAVFAGDMKQFEHARSWLERNDAIFLKAWRGRLLPWLARSSTSITILTWVQDARIRFREFRDYR